MKSGVAWRRDALERLTLCSATLIPDPEHPTADSLDLQVAAAKAAGFDGFSLWTMHAAAARTSERTAVAVREAVLGSGLRVPMVEAALPWDTDESVASGTVESALALASDYSATFVAAVMMQPELPPLRDAAAVLRALCARAADRGLRVAVEFLPWSGIPTLARLWELIEATDAPNVGILFDSWHWTRQPGGPDYDLLGRIPGEFVSVFQLSDAAAAAAPDPLEEAMTARCMIGDGVADHERLLAAFEAIGARPLVAPEVFDRPRASAGAEAMAKAIHEASERVLLGTTQRLEA